MQARGTMVPRCIHGHAWNNTAATPANLQRMASHLVPAMLTSSTGLFCLVTDLESTEGTSLQPWVPGSGLEDHQGSSFSRQNVMAATRAKGSETDARRLCSGDDGDAHTHFRPR